MKNLFCSETGDYSQRINAAGKSELLRELREQESKAPPASCAHITPPHYAPCNAPSLKKRWRAPSFVTHCLRSSAPIVQLSSETYVTLAVFTEFTPVWCLDSSGWPL